MRTALRTAIAVAVLAPLVAPALPASAATTTIFRDKGTYAEAYVGGQGTPGGLPGNYSDLWLNFHSTDLVSGMLATYDCDPGETPWGDGNGENMCEEVNTLVVWGEDLTASPGRGSADRTFSGTVDISDTADGSVVVAEGVPFDITLTAVGTPVKQTITSVYSVPETETVLRSRETTFTSAATAEGSFDGIPARGGTVGTYSVQSWERVA